MSKLTNLSVSFISLVASPATGKPVLLKSAKEGERHEVIRIVKADDERMIAYGIVYAPDQIDSHGDTADVATIRRAAYEFLREGRAKNVDREHSFTTEMAYVAESWIVRAADPLFPDEPEGAWAVGIQIGDPDIWRQLKSGELTGISLAGIAHAEPAAASVQWTEKDQTGFVAWLKSLIAPAKSETSPLQPQKEDQMDKTAVQEIVRAVLKDELPAVIKEAMKSAGVTTAPAADPPPVTTAEGELAALKSAFAALDGKIAVLTAKGATEVGGHAAPAEEESFL